MSMVWRLSRSRTLLLAVALCALAVQAIMALAGATAPSPASSTHAATRSSRASGVVLRLTIPSPTLGGTRSLVVYLPPGYADPANHGLRYPVLYLLSGAPGSAGDWFDHMGAAQTADRRIASRFVQPLILVSPDGNGGPHRDSQFLDSADGRQRVETFLVRDVIGYVDAHFRTVPFRAGRGLAGYSAGAYGALNVGLHFPNLFGTLAGFCGYYTADPREVAHPELNHPLNTDPVFLRHNSPSVTILSVPAGRSPSITLVESTVDSIYTASTRQFDALLTRHNVAHTTHIYAPRTAAERKVWPHSWTFVRYAFDDSLPAIATTLHGS